MINENSIIEKNRAKYGILDWSNTAAAIDCLFSNGYNDVYNDALQMALDMGSNTKIVTCIPDRHGIVCIFVIKFGSKAGMISFSEDFSV